MRKDLNEFRGGCIVCMDYSYYSKVATEIALRQQFDQIAKVLTLKLHQFKTQAFVPAQIYLFGSGFGGQLVIEAGRDFGTRLIGQIDGKFWQLLLEDPGIIHKILFFFIYIVCDQTGPGFDLNPSYSQKDPKAAAVNVQCIHTNGFFGTITRNCDEDWLMGQCGYIQSASGPLTAQARKLCPKFYNSAFKNRFTAVQKPRACLTQLDTFALTEGDTTNFMGYHNR